MPRKCAYFQCGKSLVQTPNLRIFGFPVHDPERLEKWIINAGNWELALLSPERLKRRILCADHFREEDFMRRKLRSTAIPISYLSTTSVQSDVNAEETSSDNVQQLDDDAKHVLSFPHQPSKLRTYSKRDCEILTSHLEKEPQPSTSTGIFHSPQQTIDPIFYNIESVHDEVYIVSPQKVPVPDQSNVNPECNVLTDLTNLPSPPGKRKTPFEDWSPTKLKRKLVETENKLAETKSALKSATTFRSARDLRTLPPFARAFVRMQLHHKNRQPFLSDEKQTALSLYYKSPSTYQFLRRKGFILPSPAAIKLWLRKYTCRPGHNKILFRLLALKVETMQPKTRECVVAFDEMALKKTLEFSKNRGLIEGFEDLGELGRTSKYAKQALVLMVRGLYASWKLPIRFYFSSSGVRAEQLEVILKSTLNELRTVNLTPVATVCDQSTTNQKLFSLLGVTVTKPYFKVDQNKYVALYDAPHLLKSIRNNMLSSDFTYKNQRISFKDITTTYTLDKNSSTGRALPKITDIHICPNPFQRMNVRLAAQIFSHSVSGAIRTAKETGQLKSDSADATASFIEVMNNAFDALNSRTLYGKNFYRRALSDDSYHTKAALEKAYNVLKELKKESEVCVKKKMSVCTRKLERPPCFDGFLLTINAVKMIFHIQSKKGYTFLLTARLNQDLLENQFSIYRQRGGYNRNPTVRTFQASFKSNVIMNLMKPPKTSNCEDDVAFDENFLNINDFPIEDNETDTSEKATSSSSSSDADDAAILNDATLEECAVTYFGGYLAKKCVDKFNCKDCIADIICTQELTDTRDILIFYRNFNINNPTALKKPTHFLTKATKIAMLEFANFFETCASKKNMYKLLIRKIEKKVVKKLPQWKENCTIHRNYLLEVLVRTLIYKRCKKMSSLMRSSNQKGSAKLAILENR